ncbi:cytochrome-c peroxidase [Pedobacter glucosidilyticus]|uniref:cytochrome-c peroxidase n=1 Tax=Pedobacter glucosidilyticus TaxID=1122941 RepID=UPI0026E9802F|nr:cytochrome c peroxidase [Pedobacter glucosidilyticus]
MIKIKYVNLKRITILLWLSLLIVSCKKEPLVEEELPLPSFVKLAVPSNLPTAPEDPDNPLSKEGIELGRRLFYDTRLSASNRISCASCHHQELAFTDGVALNDKGESRKVLHRHSPALFNLAWANKGLFWDGGSTNLESQAFAPITSPDEMHQDLLIMESELKQIPDYVQRFKLVFQDEIKSKYVAKALAQFQRSLISANSKYDKYIRKEDNIQLSTLELQGLSLVEKKCKGCHSGELFTDYAYHNNGLDSMFSDEHEGIYQGRYRVTFNPLDLGKFKTPSLRNVALTAPYMHDGRFNTLNEVLNHYMNHVKVSVSTDQLMYQNNGEAGIPMSIQEKEAIIAFLNTLSDFDFINNKSISNPHNK